MDVTAIVKRPKTAQELHDERAAAMWALFLLQSANPKPEPDGSFYLGTISNPKLTDQRIERDTPYSTARGLR